MLGDLKFLVVALTIVLVLILPACQSNTGEVTSPGELTSSFQAFQKVMESRGEVFREETGDGGILYRLESGELTLWDADGLELWRSNAEWWVDDFRLGDVDGDGTQDFLFSLWKSYRFGENKPARMENDDETVGNHLFLYTVFNGHVKSLWNSSTLPRPIFQFDLDPSGRVTVVSSGMLLQTEEGEYREDFALTETVSYTYAWEGWGFVPISDI